MESSREAPTVPREICAWYPNLVTSYSASWQNPPPFHNEPPGVYPVPRDLTYFNTLLPKLSMLRGLPNWCFLW